MKKLNMIILVSLFIVLIGNVIVCALGKEPTWLGTFASNLAAIVGWGTMIYNEDH